MKFTHDESEKKYKNSFKAGGYKPPKNTVKVKKPTVNQIFIVAKKCKCKK
jgi:hypothetical protein